MKAIYTIQPFYLVPISTGYTEEIRLHLNKAMMTVLYFHFSKERIKFTMVGDTDNPYIITIMLNDEEVIALTKLGFNVKEKLQTEIEYKCKCTKCKNYKP